MVHPTRRPMRAATAALVSLLSAIACFTAPTAATASSVPDTGAAPRAIKITTRQLGLGTRRAGTYFGEQTSIIVNTANEPVKINRIVF